MLFDHFDQMWAAFLQSTISQVAFSSTLSFSKLVNPRHPFISFNNIWWFEDRIGKSFLFASISDWTVRVHYWEFMISSWNAFGVSLCVFDAVHVARVVEFQMSWCHGGVFGFGVEAQRLLVTGFNHKILLMVRVRICSWSNSFDG